MTSSAVAETFMLRPIPGIFVLSAACLLAACAATSRASPEHASSGQPDRLQDGARPVATSQQKEISSVDRPNRTLFAMPDPEANVYFASGGSEIDGAGKVLLRRHAARLKDSPGLVVTLIGHTDPTGSRSYNLAIAEERIAAVARALRSLGVPRLQIRTVNSGRGEVPARCQSVACRARMRRVELVFSEQGR